MKINIFIDIKNNSGINTSTSTNHRKNRKYGRNGYSCSAQVKANLDIIFLLKIRGYSWSDIARLEGMSYSSLVNSVDKAVFEKFSSDHMKNECCKCCLKNLSDCS